MDISKYPRPGTKEYYESEAGRYARALEVASPRNHPYINKRIAICGDCLRMLEEGVTEDAVWEYDINSQ